MLTRAPGGSFREVSRPVGLSGVSNPPCPSLTSLLLVPRQSNASCAAIEAGSDVNTSAIESMNPGVNCTSLQNVSYNALTSAGLPRQHHLGGDPSTIVAGSPLCTRQYTPVCTLNGTATSDTCDDLVTLYNMTVSDFVEYNDDVDDKCDDLVVGNPVRVPPQRSIELPSDY